MWLRPSRNSFFIILQSCLAISSFFSPISTTIAESVPYELVPNQFVLFNDHDNDGIEDLLDNCRFIYNPTQQNFDNDFFGDACDGDDDNDGMPDDLDCNAYDNSRWTDNAYSDLDNDSIRDSWDYVEVTCFGAEVPEGRTIENRLFDNCPYLFNPEQLDSDQDGLGDECDFDDDNDGVEDEKEIIDGTDPLDRGSVLTTIKSPVYTKYNTYLNQNNFLELVNVGTKKGLVKISVYSQDGKIIDRPKGLAGSISLVPKQQRDISIHSLVGAKDRIGIVKIEWDSNSGIGISGRLSVYREDSDQYALPAHVRTYSFGFTRDLQNGTVGPLYGVSNTQSAENLDHAVENWLEIVNVEAVSKRFEVNIYDQTGKKKIYSRKSLKVRPFGEVDIPAGHNYGQGIYLVEVIPKDRQGRYFASITRYSHAGDNITYNFASTVHLRPGTSERQLLPVSNLRGDCWTQSGLIELVNTLNQPIIVQVRIRRADGSLINKEEYNLSFGPRQSIQINGAEMLDPGSVGSIEIMPLVRNSVIAQSDSYYYNCESKLETANTVQGLFAGRALQFGSYNRYLAMNNIYLLTNTTKNRVVVNLSVRDLKATTLWNKPLKALRSFETKLIDLSNSGYNTVPDSYGAVELSTSLPGAVIVQGIRRRELNGAVDFAMPSTVR